MNPLNETSLPYVHIYTYKNIDGISLNVDGYILILYKKEIKKKNPLKGKGTRKQLECCIEYTFYQNVFKFELAIYSICSKNQ